MKLKKIRHPWWHWFFTDIIEQGTEEILSPDRPIFDYVIRECTRCDKMFRDERRREYE